MAFGWKVVYGGGTHVTRVIAPPHLREEPALITVGGAGTQHIDEE
jgi:hypothetical protein